MVFQSYALYPHMTVRENIAFSLSIAGASRKAMQNEARREVARMLQLEPLLDRRPAQLSGGQRQRVAIGRALVREPEGVPVRRAALQPRRHAARADAARARASCTSDLGTTMIYVTHDQTEAMTLADQIVVLDKGASRRSASPLELYNTPANRFVAVVHRLAGNELLRSYGEERSAMGARVSNCRAGAARMSPFAPPASRPGHASSACGRNT